MSTDNKQHPLQKYRIIKVNRKQINAATYNPRFIAKENAQRLGKNLKSKGLLAPLVWNESTGNLVSGHQRLEQLDNAWLKKNKELDYTIDIAAVELSEKEEKEQNIFFNNPNAQGEFNIEMMKPLMMDIDTKEAGFTIENLEMMGIEMDLDKHENQSIESMIDQFESIKDESRAEKKIQRKIEAQQPDAKPQKDWKETKKEIREKQEEANKDADNWITLTFDNHANKAAFMERFGKEPDDKFIKGEIFNKQIERLD